MVNSELDKYHWLFGGWDVLFLIAGPHILNLQPLRNGLEGRNEILGWSTQKPRSRRSPRSPDTVDLRTKFQDVLLAAKTSLALLRTRLSPSP